MKIDFNKEKQHFSYNGLILEDEKGKKLIEAKNTAGSNSGKWVQHTISDNEWLVGFHGEILDFPTEENNYNRRFGTNKIIRLGVITGRRP